MTRDTVGAGGGGRSEPVYAVIGAGPSGLAAAWRLADSGRRVRLYEADGAVGGRLRTEEVAGRGADAVVQLLSAGYERTRWLLGAMGLADRLVDVPGRDALWRGGRAHALRYGSPASMMASGALSGGLKMRLALRYVPFLERHGGVLDLNEPVRAAEAGLDGVSAAEWGREHLGEEFVESMIYPLLAAYYGVTPEETSAAFFHALAHAGMGVEVLGARGGVGALARAMAGALASRGVELRTGAAVRALEPEGAGVAVVTERARSVHAGVVLATPPAVAASLAPLAAVPDVEARSTATVVLAMKDRVRTGWFGLSLPRREPAGEVLAAVCVQTEKSTGVVGGEGDSLVLVPVPSVGARWATAEAGAVVAEAVAGLDRVLPGLRPQILEARVVRLPGAVWVPGPGYFERLGARDPAALPPWLALAGDYLVAPTVEGAVRSGLAAADRLLVTAAPG